jgi:hypothetical protein
MINAGREIVEPGYTARPQIVVSRLYGEHGAQDVQEESSRADGDRLAVAATGEWNLERGESSKRAENAMP